MFAVKRKTNGLKSVLKQWDFSNHFQSHCTLEVVGKIQTCMVDLHDDVNALRGGHCFGFVYC